MAGGLPDWLSSVWGLDTAEGVKNCGSEEAYMDALTVFAEHIVPGAKEKCPSAERCAASVWRR